MTDFKPNITKSIDNLNKLQEDVENTITDLQEQVEEMENLETKDVTITTNTETTIEPTTGKYALEKVVITTNVQPNLEEKTVTITENTTTNITPSSGYDGISSVAVTTNVASQGYNKKFTIGDYLFWKRARLDCINDLASNNLLDGITSAVAMFRNESAGNYTFPENFSELPLFDTSQITNATYMFYNFENKTTSKNLPAYDFTSLIDATSMFQATSAQNKFNRLDADFGNSVEIAANMFRGLIITDTPKIDTSSCTNMNSMFNDCLNLVNISSNTILDFSSVTSVPSGIFSNCGRLSDDAIKHILTCLLTVPSSITYNRTLTQIGFSSSQKTKITSNANFTSYWNALVDNGWTAG